MNRLVWTEKSPGLFYGRVKEAPETTLFIVLCDGKGCVLSGAPIPDTSDGANYSSLADAQGAAERYLERWVAAVGDGHHTFDELYEHRHMLFLALMKTAPALSWISRTHADGSAYSGWFICGMHLPTGDVTYHLPDRLFDLAVQTGAPVLPTAPAFDGHTAKDVLSRLSEWIG